MYYLGIDTSCYTTSVALIDYKESLVYDSRVILNVGEGKKGVRQSEAFYQHIGNMENLIEKIFYNIDTSNLKAIGVSSKPRNIKGSYMPVFNAGLWIGNIISHSLNIPVYTLSHQEGHVLSGLWSCGQHASENLFAYHLSGGTTELIHVKGRKDMWIEKIGGTSDLKVGQFIDRVGVAMGLKFPCGREMDMLSKEVYAEKLDIPVSVKNTYVSFSGPETFVQRIINKKSYNVGCISESVFYCIAKSIEQTLLNIKKDNECKYILFVGGVASNTIIRNYLKDSKKIEAKNLIPIFADKKFSTDNGIGPAICAKLNVQG